MDQHRHARLLLAILREDWSDVERLAAAPLDPERFVGLVRECNVHPWVHARLAASGRLGLLGAEVERRLERMRRKCRQDNLLLLARAEQALDLLLDAGIVPIALKGLDTLHRFYGRFDERTLDDVDLLVPREKVGRALDVLERAGWESLPGPQRDHYLRSSHHLPLRGPGPVVVDFEIHWNLVQERRYRLRPEELFERAAPLDVSGRRVLRLEDHDLAAHLLLHHFTHYFDRRLKWSIDLAELARQPGFDWTVVADRIRAWGAGAPVGMSLLHLNKLFPDLVPGNARRRLPTALWRRLLTLPLRSRHPLDLFRGTRRRQVQLYLAGVLMENPTDLPGWLIHRVRREAQPELGPLAERRPRQREVGGRPGGTAAGPPEEHR